MFYFHISPINLYILSYNVAAHTKMFTDFK